MARNSIIFAPTSVGCKTFWFLSDVLALEMPAFEYIYSYQSLHLLLLKKIENMFSHLLWSTCTSALSKERLFISAVIFHHLILYQILYELFIQMFGMFLSDCFSQRCFYPSRQRALFKALRYFGSRHANTNGSNKNFRYSVLSAITRIINRVGLFRVPSPA